MSSHFNAKLTEEAVEDIYWRYQQGGNTYMSLANEYGVDSGTVSAILRGKTWGWLTGGKPAQKPPAPPRTHCGKGHELTDENTYWRTDKDKPQSDCRTCMRDRNNRSRRRKNGNYR